MAVSAAPPIERVQKAFRHRLFFALWPASEVALQLDTLSAALPVHGEQARKIRHPNTPKKNGSARPPEFEAGEE